MFLLSQNTHRILLRHHPRFGHIWVPGQKARIPHERGGYLVRTNEAGFRSDLQYSGERRGKPRILFFGDSMTAGDGCSNEERFSEHAAEALGAEAYNFGLPGSGTDQQLLLLEEWAPKVEKDLVVLGVYVENIQRNMLRARPTVDRDSGQTVLVPKPWFELEEDGLVLHGTPVPTERLPHSAPAERSGNLLLAAVRALVSGVRKLPGLKRMLPWLLSTKTSDYSVLRGLASRMLGHQPVPEYDDPDCTACRLLAAIIRRFHALCGPTPLLVVPIPTADHMLGKARPNYRRFFASLADPASGLHVADPSEYLAGLPLAVRKRLVFDRDAHLSPAGHEVLADFLADTVSGLGLLPRVEPRPERTEPGKPEYVLGLSCFYHNSAACLLRDGDILAAAEEERFSRVKHDRSFPAASVNYCLEEARIDVNDLKAVVFYDDPELTMERLLATIAQAGKDGRELWMRSMPSWLAYKMRIPDLVRAWLRYDGPVLKNLHHRSHAASAFYPSPFESAAILTIDGVGEWTTASIGRGRGNSIEMLKEMRFPHSLGLLYSAFTQFLGFKVNSGEYKLMGLAPYGRPLFADDILEHVVDLAPDGSLRLRMDLFGFLDKPSMISQGFVDLFGEPRKPESELTQRHCDLARSIQYVTEEAILRMARTAHELTGEKHLCLAGGVALNCVANGRILREGPFEDIWIQPAAGDAGGALGGALDAWHTHFGNGRTPARGKPDGQHASLLGPAFGEQEVLGFLESRGIPFERIEPGQRADRVAGLAAQGKVIGHFAGREEYGPRALGSRSIIADARDQEMQSILNLKIKKRESFRPFAPVVLEEKTAQFFQLDRPSPYMLLVALVNEDRRIDDPGNSQGTVYDQVQKKRSVIPAVTHVDYSARVQTVGKESNACLRAVMQSFDAQTGCPVMVNTSFNVRGEPIVNTPEDAYRCFMMTNMDVLVFEDFLLHKEQQPPLAGQAGTMDARVTDYGTALLRRVGALFDRDFLPAVSGTADPLGLKDQEPGWRDFPAPEGDPFLFSEGDPTRAWRNRELARALSPCLGRLLRLGKDRIGQEVLAEELPTKAYVMF